MEIVAQHLDTVAEIRVTAGQDAKAVSGHAILAAAQRAPRQPKLQYQLHPPSQQVYQLMETAAVIPIFSPHA
ncbi:MAG: hypothetical protein CL912_18510 [Deltaproteobacteria bacterium]|nr:hypothetical protein [Deltaproteobacteria bacterium]